jgi:hypothetical protein
MNQYQEQCRFVKFYRWLRWKPWYALRAAFVLFCWLISGAYLPVNEEWSPDRRAFAKHLWTIHMSRADLKMQHYYMIDEILKEMGDD